MIHFNFDPNQVNSWLLNLVLLAFFLLEIAIVFYIVYLLIHHVPR